MGQSKQRVIGYLRVSTAGQAKDGFGLAAQRTEITSFAKANGLTVTAWYQDAGLSGTLDAVDRPGLTDAVAALQPPPEATGLVVARLDRLARKLHIQESILQSVWRAKGKVYSADTGEILEDDPDDPMRTFFRQVMGGIAQLDRATTIKKLRDGRRAKVAEGGYGGGRPAYGLKAEGKELVTNPEEEAILTKVKALRGKGARLPGDRCGTSRGWSDATLGQGVEPNQIRRIAQKCGVA